MSHTPARIHIDGGARGNPGPAAYAYVIEWDGRRIEDAGKLGRATNNVAEYTSLIKALERAADLGARRLHIRSDSELLVRQMNGVYKVKNPDLKELYEEARNLVADFDAVTLEHVKREANKRADELCNLALDGKWKSDGAPSRHTPAVDPVRADALAILSAAAEQWSRGDPRNPPPERIWEQLKVILEDV
jgi:ribonuclease HI